MIAFLLSNAALIVAPFSWNTTARFRRCFLAAANSGNTPRSKEGGRVSLTARSHLIQTEGV